jgi:hypothetical protein
MPLRQRFPAKTAPRQSLIKAADIEAKLSAQKEGNFGPLDYANLDMLCNLYETWAKTRSWSPVIAV